MLYKHIIKPFFFLQDPEKAHYRTMAMTGNLLQNKFGRKLYSSLYKTSANTRPVELAGLTFSNRLGLAAGFDKNGAFLPTLQHMGFGFVEVGTVTPLGQSGNPKPRLFRLPKDRALINRMGFNNEGVDVLATRLKDFKKPDNLIIGGNIGKNKDTPLEEANSDYIKCYKKLHPFVDYFTVNISSPNTPGLRKLQARKPLESLLKTIQALGKTFSIKRPVFLKISPDLPLEQIEEIIDICIHCEIDGIIATNTTLDRSELITPSKQLKLIGAGGLSGAPLTIRARSTIEFIKKKVGDKLILIGVGGIYSADDAAAMLDGGADLIQIYSGMVYQGPKLIGDILDRM